MKKKIKTFLPLLLLVAVFFTATGCDFLAPINECRRYFQPFVLVWVIYPDGVVLQLATDGNGRVYFNKRGFNCGQIRAEPVIRINAPLASSVSSFDLQSPPATVTISGGTGHFTTNDGALAVKYFDGNTGGLVAQVSPNSVSPDGETMEVNVPDTSGVYDGSYIIRVQKNGFDGIPVAEIGQVGIVTYGRPQPPCQEPAECAINGGIWDQPSCRCYYCPNPPDCNDQ